MTHWRHALLGVAMVVAACAGPTPSPAPARPTASLAPTSTPAPVFIVVTVSVREHCGSIGGCAYFVSISGPGGNWTAEMEGTTSSLGSADLPAALPAARYVFDFHSVLVSDVIANGQRELGPNDAECSTTIDIVAGQSPRIEAVFDDGSCEVATSA